MLVYASRLHSKELSHERLISMVIDWIQDRRRNHMKGLSYPESLPFTYQTKTKQFDVIKEKDITMLRFQNKNENKHINFIIDILLHENEEYIDLHYYIEGMEQGVLAVAIPTIYRTLLDSIYVKDDHDLDFYDVPRRINSKRYTNALESLYQFPIVIYHNRNKKAQEKFAREIYGNAHVFYSVSEEHKNTIEVMYPNGDQVFYEEKDYHAVGDAIRTFNIQRFYDPQMSFPFLQKQYSDDR